MVKYIKEIRMRNKMAKLKSFDSLKTPEELKEYLSNVLKYHQPKAYFHYTKLSTVIKIYETGTFKAAQIKNMNDGLEKDFASDCKEYFTCLMGSIVENFGMWAMYGGIGTHLSSSETANDDIYVKIKIPSDKLKDFVINNNDVSMRAIAYTNFNSQIKKDKKPSIIRCGTCENKEKIDILDNCLHGYIKDNAWSYEKEIRLVSKKEFIDISSILNSFTVIPSPNNSIQECKMIFKRLKENSCLKCEPVFEENDYYNLVINNK